MEHELVSSGERWLQLDLDRTTKGLNFWVRTKPEVEEFINSLCDGFDALEAHTKLWKSYDPDNLIRVSRLALDINEGNGYSIQSVGGALYSPGLPAKIGGVIAGTTNLCFLRFQGISGPDGVRFTVLGPAQKDFVKKTAERILYSCHALIKDYISPVHINLSISGSGF